MSIECEYKCRVGFMVTFLLDAFKLGFILFMASKTYLSRLDRMYNYFFMFLKQELIITESW